MKKVSDNIIEGAKFTYLSGSKTLITFTDSSSMFAKPDATPFALPQEPEGSKKKYRGVVPWGENNDTPQQIISKVYKNPVVTSGMLFNIQIGYGSGIVPVRRNKETKELEQVYDCEEITDFFETNDINGYLLEQLTDMNFFYNVFPEIILNRDNPDKRKVVQLNHKDAAFSRWEEMNPETGQIETHFYSAKWNDRFGQTTSKDFVASAVLKQINPISDLLERIGRIPNIDGKTKDEGVYRYIIPVNFPTPGRFYYQKPYWYSIIESGWYDFACSVPEFKKALLKNQMTINYHIELAADYFETIFAEEKITEEKLRRARVKAEYANINKYLSGAENTGKAAFSYIKYSPDGKEMRKMKITVIENKLKGGEYIEDSEEASNIMSYGLGVHPSLIGSSPGKNKTVNGTEARELFIIKQAIMKPLRDRLLQPLYLIKKINNWPKDIFFDIPNLELTTLDKGTGAKKGIGQPALD